MIIGEIMNQERLASSKSSWTRHARAIYLISLLLLSFPALLVSGGQTVGTAVPLTEEIRLELVDSHNFLRRMVEPQASNMQALVSSMTRRVSVCLARIAISLQRLHFYKLLH